MYLMITTNPKTNYKKDSTDLGMKIYYHLIICVTNL